MKKAINEALKHVADMPGCMTYIELKEYKKEKNDD